MRRKAVRREEMRTIEGGGTGQQGLVGLVAGSLCGVAPVPLETNAARDRPRRKEWSSRRVRQRVLSGIVFSMVEEM